MICANKIDVEPHATEGELVAALNLDYITEQAWVVCVFCFVARARAQGSHARRGRFPVSALRFVASRAPAHPAAARRLTTAVRRGTNLDRVLAWLIAQKSS